jgi:hypothetical protein
MAQPIQHLRGTAAEWATDDIVVPQGELALLIDGAGDIASIRIGNGVDVYSALTDFGGGGITLPIAQTDVTGLVAALGAKAPLASPALTGTPSAPTPINATNSTQIATTAFVQSLLAALVGAAPGTLDQLNEIATALGNDPNFAATITASLATKQPIDATLTALATLAGGADKLAYFTGVDVLAQADLTAFGRTLIGLASYAALRTGLNVADGATANSADAFLLARANHTGVQAASTISDFAAAADARIAAAVINALSDVTITSPTAGQVLKYNGTAFVNDTDATGGGADSRAPRLSTDFSHRNAVQDDFTIAIIGTGAAFTTAPVAGALSANHPGVHQWRSGTTANSGVQCATDTFAFRIGGGEQWDVRFFTGPVLTTVNWRSGAMDSITVTAPVDGVWLAMDLNGNLVGRTRSNSVQSATATIAALAVSTWYHGRISINAAANLVTFEVFTDAGVSLGSQTLSANIPTAAGREVGWGSIMTSTGTVAIELGHIDWQQLTNPGRTVERGAA